jgi:hypothetical protein
VAHLGVSRVTFLRIVMNITEAAFTNLVLALAADVLAHHGGKARHCTGRPGVP